MRRFLVLLLWLVACEATPAGRATPPGEDALAGVDLQQPLDVVVERRTLREAVDRAKQELRIRWANGRLQLELERNDGLVAADYVTFELDAQGLLRERSSSRKSHVLVFWPFGEQA